jgi:hypothetical protein
MVFAFRKGQITEVTKRSPMDGGDDSVGGFPLCFFCFILLQAHLAYVNQLTEISARDPYHVVITSIFLRTKRLDDWMGI